jgi:hypothetical protein
MKALTVERTGTTDVSFPLTPALSLGERENSAQRVCKAGAARDVERLAPSLPLPEGEGRGEGEADVRATSRQPT